MGADDPNEEQQHAEPALPLSDHEVRDRFAMLAIIWSGPDTASITTNRPGCHVVKVTDPEEVRRYGSPSLPTPEQRTRRDVAAIIT